MKTKGRLGVFILGLLAMISVVEVVSAETLIEAVSNTLPSLESIAGSFGGISQTDSFVWFLIFSLVALVIYSISPFVPFLSENKYVAWAVTLIVAYLSTFSLKIEEIKILLVSYNTLGLVITGVIPFFAIAAISK